MTTLTNLTNEPCQLLIEVLEKEERKLQSLPAPAKSRDAPGERLRRLERVERLLRNTHEVCSTPNPDDAELRNIGSYC
jgi:hypothetical protein